MVQEVRVRGKSYRVDLSVDYADHKYEYLIFLSNSSSGYGTLL